MKFIKTLVGLSLVLLFPRAVLSQAAQPTPTPVQIQIKEIERTAPRSEPRPNIKAYLEYLKQELTVTDDRRSRREVNPAYIRHNFNRVSALRAFALKLASRAESDYMPEMEAVTEREFHILFFDQPPPAAELKVGEVYNFIYRYLGSEKNAETFYIFARLDPYEEEEIRRKLAQGEEARREDSGLKEKTAPLRTENASEQKTESVGKGGEKRERVLPREVFLSEEDKKKAEFLKKNP